MQNNPQRTYFKKDCKKCGQPLMLEDLDYRFSGCQDEIYYCPNCDTHVHIKVRYGTICSVKWFLGVPYSTVKTH